MFTLTCSCGSTDFEFNSEFECLECGTVYSEQEAGSHLLETEE